VVVDTSALMALLLAEPDARLVAEALEDDPSPIIAAPTLVEAMIVTEARLGAEGVLDLQRILAEADIITVPFDEGDAFLAAEAWRRFGKGRHSAGLNLGDCFAYAVATRRGERLLFVGDDFGHTDVEAALGPEGFVPENRAAEEAASATAADLVLDAVAG